LFTNSQMPVRMAIDDALTGAAGAMEQAARHSDPALKSQGRLPALHPYKNKGRGRLAGSQGGTT
jgi:hypothetical protein